MSFELKRGANISRWLTDFRIRGRRRRRYLTSRDLECIAELGFDHIRLPISELELWRENGAEVRSAFDSIDRSLDWAGDCGLRVIVDLHSLRSHRVGGGVVPSLFSDQQELDKLRRIWLSLSKRIGHRSCDSVAYEILNEPNAPDDNAWNHALAFVYGALRKAEPDRTILVGSNGFQVPRTLGRLKVPERDANLILTFHFYSPLLVTHYRAHWTQLGSFDGPVRYPGRPIDPEELDRVSEPLKSRLARTNAPVTPAVLVNLLKPALGVRDETGLRVHCGEFGCSEHTPPDIRSRWVADVVRVLEQYDISWTYWDWKGTFGILDRRTWLFSGIQESLGLKSGSEGQLGEPLVPEDESLLSRTTRVAGHVIRKGIWRVIRHFRWSRPAAGRNLKS